MKKNDRNIIIGAALLLVILVATVVVTTFLVSCPTSASGFAMIVCETPDGNGGDGEMSFEETLAKCLTDKGIKMYGSEYCGHCTAQKEAFGDAFQYIDYVECGGTDACQVAGISGVPTWVSSDLTKYPGNRKISDLADLFEC